MAVVTEHIHNKSMSELSVILVFQCTLNNWNFIHMLQAISGYTVHKINFMAIFLLFLSYDLYVIWLSSSTTFLPR
jgi:hypothetical protein